MVDWVLEVVVLVKRNKKPLNWIMQEEVKRLMWC